MTGRRSAGVPKPHCCHTFALEVPAGRSILPALEVRTIYRYAPAHGIRGLLAASAVRASRAGCRSGIHRLLRVAGLGNLCLPDRAVRDHPLASSGGPCAGTPARVRFADVAGGCDRGLYGGYTGARYPAAAVSGTAGGVRHHGRLPHREAAPPEPSCMRRSYAHASPCSRHAKLQLASDFYEPFPSDPVASLISP